MLGGVLHGLAVDVVELERESHGDWEEKGRLLSGGEDQRWQEDGLALLARDEAAEDRLARWVGDHAVGPEHVQPCGTDGDEDVDECIANNVEAQERGEQVGEAGVHHVVKHTEAKTSPAGTEATNAVKEADCGCDLRGDWLVVDDRDFHIGVCVCLSRHERLFLRRGVGLVGVGWWALWLDDGGGGWGFDHGQGSHNLADGVADGGDDEQGDQAGDDDWEEFARVQLNLWSGLLVKLSILVELVHVLLAWAGEVFLSCLHATLDNMANEGTVDGRHLDDAACRCSLGCL